MVQPPTIPAKARPAVPLVLPHIVLSVGLLTFAVFSERGAESGVALTELPTASATGAIVPRRIHRG